MNRSYGTETQPEPSVVDSKIRNETHGLIVYNIPKSLNEPLRRAGLTMPKLLAMSFNQSEHHLTHLKSYVR